MEKMRVKNFTSTSVKSGIGEGQLSYFFPIFLLPPLNLNTLVILNHPFERARQGKFPAFYDIKHFPGQ